MSLRHFQILTELYRHGKLCQCKRVEKVYDDQTTETEIQHEENCEGRVKVMAVLEEVQNAKV